MSSTRTATPRALLFVLPLLVVHNLEEALTVRPFLASHASVLGDVLPVPRYEQFLVALAVVTVVPLLVVLLARRVPGRVPLVPLLLGLQLVMLLNVFSHLGMAWLVRGYVPGLATALGLELPFSLYLFHFAFWDRWVSRGLLALLVPTALLVHGPLLLGLMWLAGRLTTG